jgi:hypothetical protein
VGRYWDLLIEKIIKASEEDPLILIVVALGGITVGAVFLALGLALWESFKLWTLLLVFGAAVIGVFLDEIFFSNKK